MNRLSGGHLAFLGLALTLACSPTPNILPTNDFNRPTDIAFMCLGAFGTPGTDADGNPTETGPFQVTGRPMRACHLPPVTGMKQTPIAASIQNRTFAFVPNSASGDLSVVDADKWKIIDLNKATGGYGRIPLGSLPEQISASSDGCRLMSANRGSCDLSLVDPSTLLAGVFNAEYGDVTIPSGNGVQRVVPRRKDGKALKAAPYEAVFLPQDTQVEGRDNLCPIDGRGPGNQWRALVTFPSCNLVALLEMPSGTILASAKAERIPDPLVPGQETVRFVSMSAEESANPVCPVDDCRGGPEDDAGAGGAIDAGVDPDGGADADDGGADADDGGTPTMAMMPTSPDPQPTSIAIMPRANHAYVSFANVPAIFSLELTPDTVKAAGRQGIPLYEGAQGSNRIRLGVDPYPYTETMKDADGNDVIVYNYAGRFVGAPNRQYLYVIARDGSLRIVDVSAPGQTEQECATNFDPLIDSNKKYTPATACIPFNEAKRRQYSTAVAGLRFPTIPIDVAAADLSGPPTEDTVNGGYAWVLTANGTIYLVNIDPVQREIKAVVHEGQTEMFQDLTKAPEIAANRFVVRADPMATPGLVPESPPFPNRPRDRSVMSFSASLDPALGPARLDLPPLGLPTGPYIEPLWTQGTEDNATAVDTEARQTFVFFPDREAVIAQGWDVTWQGILISPRYSGILHGNVLQDGAGFCSAGVLRGDIVTLLGCLNTAQCPAGMVCQRDPTLDAVPGGFTVTGLCIDANKPALPAECAGYVSSVRRYEIDEALNGQVTLVPHLDEVVRSSVSECRYRDEKGMIITGTGGTGGAAGTGGTTGTGGAAGAGGTGGATGTGGAPAPTSLCLEVNNDCFDPVDGTTCDFRCVEYQGKPRCLHPCKKNEDCRPGRVCQPPTPCTDLTQCPTGTAACKGGFCFTDTTCDAQVACKEGQSCLPDPADTSDMNKRTICAFDRSFCADGPPLGRQEACFPQLTAYHVSANASFVVTGAQAGSFSAGKVNEEHLVYPEQPDGPKVLDDPTQPLGTCIPFPPDKRDARLVSRIPLRPRPGVDPSSNQCVKMADQTTNPLFPTLQTTSPIADGYYFDRFDPALKPTIIDGKAAVEHFISNGAAATANPEAPQLVNWMKTWAKDVSAPNACIYLGGPLDKDRPHNADPTTRPDRLPQHTRARFRNTQIAFLLANIDRAPSTNATIHFDVHGGSRLQSVNSLTTVEVSAPARLILGPIDSNNAEMSVKSAAPYFFVVDQRRLGRGNGGGATRGQIVRVNPFGQPTAAISGTTQGLVPTYEDYTRTGGLFPIQ